jgi:hypothetical protein
MATLIRMIEFYGLERLREERLELEAQLHKEQPELIGEDFEVELFDRWMSIYWALEARVELIDQTRQILSDKRTTLELNPTEAQALGRLLRWYVKTDQLPPKDRQRYLTFALQFEGAARDGRFEPLSLADQPWLTRPFEHINRDTVDSLPDALCDGQLLVGIYDRINEAFGPAQQALLQLTGGSDVAQPGS